MSRLVEILSNYYEDSAEVGHVHFFTMEESEELAKYLEAHKVVLPPVDIGDTLWYIEGGYYNASYMRPKEVEVKEITKKKTKSGKATEWGFIAGCTRYSFSSIGKTIFWTKKECEAAIEKKKKSSRRFT
jgi:hypothetical protein